MLAQARAKAAAPLRYGGAIEPARGTAALEALHGNPGKDRARGGASPSSRRRGKYTVERGEMTIKSETNWLVVRARRGRVIVSRGVLYQQEAFL